MGETKKRALRMEFDRKVKLEFHGAKITSDAGLLAYRELDDALGLMETASEHLEDFRTGKNTFKETRIENAPIIGGRLDCAPKAGAFFGLN